MGNFQLVTETLTVISTMTSIPTFMWWRSQNQSFLLIGTHLKHNMVGESSWKKLTEI